MEQNIKNVPGDGSWNLEYLMKYCELIKENSYGKVFRISKSTGTNVKQNRILYERKDTKPKSLLLIKVANENKIPEITNKQMSEGKHLVFNTRIYVEDKDELVLGFR